MTLSHLAVQLIVLYVRSETQQKQGSGGTSARGAKRGKGGNSKQRSAKRSKTSDAKDKKSDSKGESLEYC